MKLRLFFYLFLVLCFCWVAPVFAQDANTTPEPGTRADNECYSGGTMEGKCDRGFHADGSVTKDEIEWAWRCGWYMARYNDGSIWREAVPSDCVSLLPGITPPTVSDCLTLVNNITYSEMVCLIGNNAVDIIDGISDGTPYHHELIVFWVISDPTVGNGGKCTYFASDLSSFTPTPVDRWIRDGWLRNGFKPTDDVCAFAPF